MILKFLVELMKRTFAQLVIAFHQKRAERTLRERLLATGLVGQNTKLHVHVGQLRKSILVAAERDAAERKNPLLRLGENVRLHPANLVQLDPPISQRWIDHELRELLVVDRLNFGYHERRCFADLRQ